MNQKNEQIKEIIIPEGIAIFEDAKTKAKTVAFPFQFLDNKNGVVMVSRLSKMPWNPHEHIKRIIIEFT